LHRFVKICVVGLFALALSLGVAKQPFGRVSNDQRLGPDSLLKALEGIRFDLKHVYRVRDLSLRRDSMTLTLDRGHLIFLEPVSGVVTGCLFWGQGTLVAVPPEKI